MRKGYKKIKTILLIAKMMKNYLELLPKELIEEIHKINEIRKINEVKIYHKILMDEFTLICNEMEARKPFDILDDDYYYFDIEYFLAFKHYWRRIYYYKKKYAKRI